MSTQNYVEAFRTRQKQDLVRFGIRPNAVARREPFQRAHTETETETELSSSTLKQHDAISKYGNEGKETWRTSEGDSLNDFGVDDEAEFYDEEELPLADILHRRKLSARPLDAKIPS